jgi:uncharacterized protein
MKIRLDQLGDESFTWEESLALTPRGDQGGETPSCEDFAHPDVVDLSEVACRSRITSTTPGHHLRLELAYKQTLACTRCLGPLKQQVELTVDLIVLVADDQGQGEEERELAEADLGVLMLEEPSLNTWPIVVEQVELGVPMQALCREDCAGLCPRCGADLNAGSCACQDDADPRWAALAKLKSGS